MKVGDFEIKIIRNARRKTITVNIERDGSVNAVAPMDCSDEVIYKELLAREYTISQHVANRLAVSKAKINRNFVNGQSFLFMGASYNLEISETAKKPLEIIDDKFVLKKECLPKACKHPLFRAVDSRYSHFSIFPLCFSHHPMS